MHHCNRACCTAVVVVGKPPAVADCHFAGAVLPQVFALNGRVQAQNRAPIDFPAFIRQGFDITVVGDGYVMDADG